MSKIKMNELEQKTIKKGYEKIDEFMDYVLYGNGIRRIIVRPEKAPLEYEYNPKCSQHNGCEKNLRKIFG